MIAVRKEDVLVALTAEMVLDHAGADHRRSGRNLRTQLCPNRQHSEDVLSVQATDGRWRCFVCGSKGHDLLSLLAAYEHLNGKTDFPRVLELGAKLAGVSPNDTPEEREARKRAAARRRAEAARQEAREKAELARVVARLHTLPTETDDEKRLRYIRSRQWERAYALSLIRFPLLDFPTNTWGPILAHRYEVGALLFDAAGEISGAQFRRVGNKAFCTIGSGSFGSRCRTATAKRVILVEGLSDYLVAASALDRWDSPVIGVPGADLAPRLMDECTFRPGAEVEIALDDDETGNAAAEAVARIVAKNGARPLRAKPEEQAA